MTREEFIEVLDKKGYLYEIEGDKIVVTRGDDLENVELYLLKTIPPGVEFKNSKNVNLDGLKELPQGIKFLNGERVILGEITFLPPDVEFRNDGEVWLNNLREIPFPIEFHNSGDMDLRRVKTIHPGVKFNHTSFLFFTRILNKSWIHRWSGNIEGIGSTKLFNVMISKSLFVE